MNSPGSIPQTENIDQTMYMWTIRGRLLTAPSKYVHVHGDAKYVRTTLISLPGAAHSEVAGRISLATLRIPRKARTGMSSSAIVPLTVILHPSP
jgi:hypothetical protein